jgi:hemoglobin
VEIVLALLVGAVLGVGAMFLAPRRPTRPPAPEHSRDTSPAPPIDDEGGLAFFVDQWDAPVAELDGQRGRPDPGWTLLGTADSWAEAKRGLYRIASQSGRPGEVRIVVRLPGTSGGGAGFGGYFAKPPRLPAAARASTAAAPAPVPQGSLYEQIGGDAGLTAVVKDFYHRMRTDRRFGERFLLVDMAQLLRHQVMLLTVLTGGPNIDGYTIDQLHIWVQRAHVRMGLTHADFDAMAGHLLGAGSDHGIGDDQLQAIANALEGFRSDIVTTAEVARPVF